MNTVGTVRDSGMDIGHPCSHEPVAIKGCGNVVSAQEASIVEGPPVAGLLRLPGDFGPDKEAADAVEEEIRKARAERNHGNP